MKKVLSIFITMLMFALLVLPVAAAGIMVTVTPSAATVTAGETIIYTVSLGGVCKAKSGSISVSYGSDFELVSGEFLKSGATLSRFDAATNLGALAFQNETDLSGAYFKLVLKAKVASASAQTVRISVTLKNGATEVGSGESTVSTKIGCKNHAYGTYSKTNDGQHQRICSVCGYVETSNHTWNSGTVTKPVTCKESGTKVFSCTACGAEKTETVAKNNAHKWGEWHITKQPTCTTPGTTTKTCLVCGKTEDQTVGATGHSMGGWTQSKAPTCTENGEEKRSCSKCSNVETRTIKALGHSFSNPMVTKQPTCTEPGIESGKCSRCGQTTTNTIKAKGHGFGAWMDTKEATCTEGGTQERKCFACDAVESRTTKALGHDFENPTIVKEATISSTGLKEGKCKRCGEITSEVIPCSAKDETTGAEFEADEGVFEAGTELVVEEIYEDNPSYTSAENALKESISAFKLYSLTATKNGVVTQPNGEVTVTLPIPDGFGTDVALYLLAEDGTAEEVEAVVSEDGKTISAKLTKLGKLAIGKLGEGTPTGPDGNTSTDTPAGTDDNASTDTPAATKNHTVLYIVLIVVVLGAGAAVAVVLIKKKRAKTEML